MLCYERRCFSLKQKLIIGVISLVVIGVIANTLLSNVTKTGITDEGTGVGNGDTPPQFTLENLQEEQVSLNDFRGKKVILNFWATWCLPCRTEMPAFQSFSEQRDDVVVLAVNMTHKDSVNKITGFLADNDLTFPVVLDPKGQVSKAYSVINIPSTYFINEDGSIHDRVEGVVDETKLEQYVEQM